MDLTYPFTQCNNNMKIVAVVGVTWPIHMGVALPSNR